MSKLALAATATLFVAAAAHAGFDPANWTIAGTTGSIQISPDKMVLTSGNSATQGETTASYTSPYGGKKVSFDWTILASPDTGIFDYFGYSVNGTYFGLANNETSGGGSVSVLLSAGDVFAFHIGTLDGVLGSLTVSVTNFSSVPAPGAFALLGLAGLVGRRRRA